MCMYTHNQMQWVTDTHRHLQRKVPKHLHTLRGEREADLQTGKRGRSTQRRDMGQAKDSTLSRERRRAAEPHPWCLHCHTRESEWGCTVLLSPREEGALS